MKRMLSIDELIEHMKTKGITFNEVSEEDAKVFLQKNNYYMKLAAYRANYEKCKEGRRAGQYKKLDFGYLKELSIIDMHLRYIIINMCLDIEHAIKVRILESVTNDPKEDGYQVVSKFMSGNRRDRILKKITISKSGEYCRDLINKYFPDFPIWVFVEVISFGDLLYFCSYYEKEYGVKIVDNKLMNTVRDIRNAAAHSNCLLNKMTERLDWTKQVDSQLSNFIGNMDDISCQSRKNNLKYKFTNSFITLLYVYDGIMSVNTRQRRYEELHAFMSTRAVKNKHYFLTNTKIVGVYNFHKKVIDNLLLRAYN